MKKIRLITIFITTVFILSVCDLRAQRMIMPPDTNLPVIESCIGKIISCEHLQLSNNIRVNVMCYWLDTVSQ